MDTNLRPVAPTARRGKYRHHSQDFKRELVELSLQLGASVARIAREHGVNANQVFSWRRQYQQGLLDREPAARLDGLVPVTVHPEVPRSEAAAPGSIVIEARAMRVSLSGSVDGGMLAAVLDRLFK
jgi:transposase